MNDHARKRHAAETPGARTTATQDAERRGGERQMFTASAEVIEIVSGARFSTRTTDLGPGGCFIDTTVPFPVGSKLRVNLHKGKTSFETSGTVVYSQTGLGMGIAFDQLTPERRADLKAWLIHLSGEPVAAYDSPRAPKKSVTQRSPEYAALVRLVQLMVGKGILTEAEGAFILHDPVL